MRAAIMRGHSIVVDEMPDPEPLSGQVLVKTLACGICGSDLHALKHLDKMVASTAGRGPLGQVRPERDLVMGHEYCAEILDYGPDCSRRLKPDTRVCSYPMLAGPQGRQAIGYSNVVPGGYGEYMLLNEELLLPVPEGLPTAYAALTEPMAVGWHAVQMARMDKADVPLVVGCGPVGLAVIAALKLSGAGPIVAADFSPRRRSLAAALGADVVVDPGAASPYESWREAAELPPDPDSGAGLFAVPGPRYRPAVIFECVGVPGVLDQIMAQSPRGARIVVVGVCMESDTIMPIYGINKELNLQFVLAYTPQEFALSLRHLAEGQIDAEAMLTGSVGLDGVAGAFDALASPEQHCKIMVTPWN